MTMKPASPCEHYKDTGKPFDFRFPCAFPRCPAGVDGTELHVPVPRTGSAALEPTRDVMVFERLVINGGESYTWERRE